jgi:predicted RNA-binding Zn-ribbon protein involved in translation (DUF1610 family)
MINDIGRISKQTRRHVMQGYFVCPRCGVNRLEEVVNAVVVQSVWFGDEELEYGEQNIESGTVDHYRCSDCGYVVPGVKSLVKLLEWVNNPDRDESDVGDECKDEWMDEDEDGEG